MKKPEFIYSTEDRKRLDKLDVMKAKAFDAAKLAHKDPSKKVYADQRMDEYLKEAAECALLGTASFTVENGQVTKIFNYLWDVKWYAHAPGEETQFGTYRGLMIFFDKIRYEENKIVCRDTMKNGDNFRYLSSDRDRGIKHFGGGEYELDKAQFVPLKMITPPDEIFVGDYFFASAFGRGGVQFKPINSFASNPWSDAIDSFVCNSVYSFYGFCGGWRAGKVHMLKSDDKLNELLSNAAVWI